MSTPFTDKFDMDFLLDTMMGPNAMRIAEELASYLPLCPGMRVLDLGCGMGISSILLAEKYSVTVFAADLWITPTENAARFARLGLKDKIIPLSVDASEELPFAHDYFDMIISVDAYHYFGANTAALPRILQYLKTGGAIAIAMPGLKQDFYNDQVPQELQPYWQEGMHFHSCNWWRELWQQDSGVEITECREMDCCRQAWADWLRSSNPHARHDVHMLRDEGGKHFNFVQIMGRKI